MNRLDQIIGIAVGAALGARALDDRKPLWARIAYGAVGFDLISGALRTGQLGDGGVGRAPVGPQKSAAGKNVESGVPLNFEERRVKSIDQRVAFVHEQMVKGTRDPLVYQLARKVLGRKVGGEDGDWEVPEKDNWAEAQTLFKEVRKRVRYTWDPTDYDAFQTPRKTLALKAGDCDDQVALLGAMLRSIGLQVRSRIVQTKGESNWNHIYLTVNIPGKGWIPLDPTVNQPPGWEVPAPLIIRKQDFAVKEEGGAPRVKERS